MVEQTGSLIGKLVLLIGPSGVGKSVILKRLKEKYSHKLHFPHSATTRARRQSEGDDLYYFLSDEEFDALLAEDKILEWAQVHSGARYGTLVHEIIPAIQQGKIVVREVDVQGFNSIRMNPLFAGENAPYILQSIFILPENKEQLIQHITKRAPIENDELQRRIASVEMELQHSSLCTAQIVNVEGKLDATIEQVEKVIF